MSPFILSLPHSLGSFNRFQTANYDESGEPGFSSKGQSGNQFSGNTPLKNRTPLRGNQFEMSPINKEFKNSVADSPYT